ncbi:hypothetical protein [Marinoscillum sp.]|uniref:hypothetical protein n=1 Tax=Marinoscillum sp. TaxID=2024838 RepID=UPI003BA99EB2
MKFIIEDLFKSLNISENQSKLYSEGLIVSLESHNHSSVTKLKIDGLSTEILDLIWSQKVNKAGWREPKDYTEAGALALALFSALNFTDYDYIEQSMIGTGFDYYLSYSNEHPSFDGINIFQAKMEVSGILSGDQSQIRARLSQKINQCRSNPVYQNLSGYVSISEFSNPITHFVKL